MLTAMRLKLTLLLKRLRQKQRYSVGEQMRRLLKLIAPVSAEEMINRVEFLSAWD
jgi:hypothetical protein